MRRVLSAVIACVTIPAIADIIPIPGSQRVKPAFDSSDLVCSGTVTAVRVRTFEVTTGNSLGLVSQQARAAIEVEQTYKELTPPGRTIIVLTESEAPKSSSEYSIFREGDEFLVFLKVSPTGGYNLADPFLGATRFHSLPEQPRGQGLAKLQNLLAATLLSQNQEDVSTALRLLEGFDNIADHNLEIVSRLYSATKPAIALAAIDVSLSAKTPESLAILVRYLDEYKGNAEPMALTNIGNRLADFRDPQSLPSIRRLARSRFLPIRQGAIRSLRARRDPRCIPELVERLDDSDGTIRYIAVISLAETLGKYEGDYAPSMYLFDKKPQYYTDLWKKWWDDEGSKLYPPNDPAVPQ